MRQPELGGLLKAATNMVGIHYLSCQLSGCLAFRDSISGLLAEGMVTPEMGFLFMSFQWGFLLLPTKIVVSEWCFYSILYLLMSFYIYNYRQCLQGRSREALWGALCLAAGSVKDYSVFSQQNTAKQWEEDEWEIIWQSFTIQPFLAHWGALRDISLNI